MATRNIARPSTPSKGTKPPPDPATLLEEKSVQLHSLLCYCHGTGTPTQDDAGPIHRNNVFWLASQLAEEVMELVQVVAGHAHSNNEPFKTAKGESR